MSVRVRFAPSPTGYLHIGGARTALFNWLYARRMKGTFVLRIEDTDEVRSTPESVSAIVDSMKWLGLDWDEGPTAPKAGGGYESKGPHAPYFQMERTELYKKYADQLLAEGKAYRCYCSKEDLDAIRRQCQLEKRPPRYDGRCRHLTEGQRKDLEAKGKTASVRLRMPDNGATVVHDGIRGDVSFENALQQDLVIVKTAGGPTYNFAVVVDDHLMGITHVVRGDEHLSNTPSQIQLYRALGWEPPTFSHLSMILGPDGQKLSKRHGATSVLEYRDQGYLPETMRNYLALLGWSTKDSQQLFAPEELIEKFDLAGCQKNPATFDPVKLNWMNGENIRKRTPAALLEEAWPFLEKAGLGGVAKDRLAAAVALEREKVKLLSEVPGLVDFFFREVDYLEEAKNKVLRPEGAVALLEDLIPDLQNSASFGEKELEVLVRDFCARKNVKPARVFHPIRVAISGRTTGPSLFGMMEVLGKAEVVRRIQNTVAMMTQSRDSAIEGFCTELNRVQIQQPFELPFDAEYAAKYGIEVNPTPHAFYFPPRIQILDAPSSGKHVFWLFSAPAAVGKSMLARHLLAAASQKNKLLVLIPLKKYGIDSGFFTGLLGDLFPSVSKREMLAHIREGRVVLAFDGYDEVSMSQENIRDNIDHFIGAMHKDFENFGVYDSGKASVFFFYRPFIEAHGLFVAMEQYAYKYEVMYFSRSEATQYLIGHVDHFARVRYPQQLARLSTTELKHYPANTLDMFCNNFSIDEKEFDAFFGHAIVLGAFGDFVLDDLVYQRKSGAQFRDNARKSTAKSRPIPVRVLNTIVDTILVREYEKFDTKAREILTVLGTNSKVVEDSLELMYSPEMQRSILSSIAQYIQTGRISVSDFRDLASNAVEELMARDPIASACRANVEAAPQFRKKFLEQLESMLHNHPFLNEGDGIVFRNRIYFEFFLAELFAKNLTIEPGVLLTDKATLKELSVFFAAFLCDALDYELEKLHPETLYCVCNLFATASDWSGLRFAWDSNLKGWRGEIVHPRITFSEFLVSSGNLRFEIPSDGVFEKISVQAPRGAQALKSCRVDVGYNAANAVLGFLDAAIDAEVVSVKAKALFLEKTVISAGTLKLNSDLGDFVLSRDVILDCDSIEGSARIRDQITSFVTAARGAKEIVDVSLEVKQGVTDVLSWFRRHGKETFGMYDKKFDTIVTRKGRQTFFTDFMFGQGIIYRREGSVIMNADRARQYGIHYRSFNNVDCMGAGFEDLKRAFVEYRKTAST